MKGRCFVNGIYKCAYKTICGDYGDVLATAAFPESKSVPLFTRSLSQG